LLLEEARIGTIGLHEALVETLFDDSPVLDHDHVIGEQE
jgi:hypothetical protein